MVMAGTFIFSGLTVQHQALMRRQMRFKELAIIDVVTMFIGIIIGTSMVVLTKSYWSLVVLPATSAFAIILSVWIVSGWIPGTPKRGTGVTPMLKFGGNLTAFNGLCYLVANADNVLIGWCWGAGPPISVAGSLTTRNTQLFVSKKICSTDYFPAYRKGEYT